MKNNSKKLLFMIFILTVVVHFTRDNKKSIFSHELPVKSMSITNSLPEDLKLSPTHPDESVDYTFDQRFSTDNALDNVSQIQGALVSFQALTTKAEPILEKKILDDVGNTLWEIQYLAFPNWIGGIKGTIKKQDYQIKKLELELAQIQYEAGEIDQADLNSKAKSYKLAKQSFVEFWNSFTLSD